MPNTRKYSLLLLILLVVHLSKGEIALRLDFNESIYFPVAQSANLKYSIEILHKDSQGIPEKCKRDYCKFEESHDEMKGTLQWNTTPVGSRRVQRCPYAFNDDWRTASFDCLPGPQVKRSVWRNLNMTLCPNTPLTEALRMVYEEQIFRDDAQNGSWVTHKSVNSSSLMKSAAHLDNTMRRHSQVNMLSTEWTQVYRLMLESPITSDEPLIEDDCEVIYSIWDSLVANVHVMLDADQLENTRNLEKLPNIFATICMRTSYLGLLTSLPVSLSHESSAVEALEWSRDAENREIALKMGFSTRKELSSFVKVQMPLECEVCDLAVVAFRDQPLVQKNMNFDDTNEKKSSKKKYSQHGPVVFIEVHNKNGTDLTRGSMDIQVEFPKHNIPQHMVKSLVKCGYSSFFRPKTRGAAVQNSKEDFHLNRCVTTDNAKKDTVICACSVTATKGALLTLFFAEDESFVQTRIRSNPSDVGVFLRFPYKKDLNITGYVLKGLSTVCLLLTLLSYGLFRKAHRGILTKILLHLVSAMLCVNLIFFISIVLTGSYMGCRVANALRLYFVLVSLMWNGVEAVNMYLLLIQVFNSTVEHFILKASLIAWGVPLLPVAISLVVNKYSFDGEWVQCNFVCSLPKMTLYWAFLLPLTVTMLFNLTVFSLVLRVIRSKHKATPAKGIGRNRIIQLSGAVAMLVLLGVPWIFGVFGVIDDSSNDELALTQFIFNIIFIVGFNFQGMFIFWFHCLRISEISNSWKMKFATFSLVFKSLGSHDSSSTGTSRPNTAVSVM